MRLSRTGAWLIIGAAMLWGTTGTAQALGPPSQPVSVGATRLIVGAAGLLAVGVVTGWQWPRAADWPWIAAAGVGIALYQPFFFGAVIEAGVATGTLVALGSAPIFTGVLARIVFGDRVPKRWVVGTLIALAGLALLTGLGFGGAPSGYAFAGAAGAAYAIYAVGTKHLLQTRSAPQVMAWCFTIGALLSTPLLLVGGTELILEPGGLLMIMWLGLAATTLAYTLFGFGSQRTAVPTTASLSLVEPVTASLLGVAVLGEHLVAGEWVGMGVAMAGLVVAGYPRTSQDSSAHNSST